jgi:uroporphyrinogen decarboxylase
MVWTENDFPHPLKLNCTTDAIASLAKPCVKTDGLLPFVISRMARYHDKVKAFGCHYRFACSRGPLNIASFLFGTTDFMMALALTPDEVQKALTVIPTLSLNGLNCSMKSSRTIKGSIDPR